ncbi:MAG: LytTR family DNA-binding domain-containing protein [Woeseiaceae bacterium]|nr:LytTR family DNA-binding domain-containing protein [Woeseiaceae bacterium]
MASAEGQTGAAGSSHPPPLRRALEALAWFLLIAFLWGIDLLTKLAEVERLGLAKTADRLIVEQVTSGLAVLVLVPLVARWVSMFPLRRGAWAAAIVGHTAGTVLFAFGHQTLMILQRIVWFSLRGETYIWREPFVANLIVEYQKDIKIYLGIVAIIAVYRYLRDIRAPRSADTDGRLLVQSGSGERLLRFEEIAYLEAAGNYVSVFAQDREFLLRETMAGVLERLPDGRFLRTHRRYIVNLDRVVEIRSEDGKQSVILDAGQSIPVSRGYRPALRNALPA